MTTIDDLPFTVIDKILSYDWDPPTLIRAAEASRKIDFWMRKRSPQLFETDFSNLKVRPCVGRDKYLWTQDTKDGSAYLLYGASVGALLLTRTIAAQDYNLLAESFFNLKHLEVGWLNLELFKYVGTTSSFQKLTKLKLGSPRSVNQSFSEDYSDKEILDNISGLIGLLGQAKFPKLEDLYLSFIFEESRQNVLLDSILTFLARHEKTLQFLVMLMAGTSYDYEDMVIQDWHTVPNFDARVGNLSLSLQHLFVHFNPYYESPNFLQIIDHISRTQTSIQSHVVLYPRFAAFYTDILEDNWRTLTAVAYNMWIFYTLDCTVFEQCSVLQDLILHARPKKLEEFESENYRGEPASTELVNIENLPKSLTRIRVANFFIQTKDTVKFTTEFPKLERLSLIGIGEKEDLGFSLEMFSSLLHRGVKVGIYRGFNKRLLNESDNGPVTFMTLSLLNNKKVSEDSHVISLSGLLPKNKKGSELGHCLRGTLPYRWDGFIEFDFSKYQVYQGQED